MEIPWEQLAAVFELLGTSVEGGGPDGSLISFRSQDGGLFFHAVTPEGTVDVNLVLEDVERTVAIGGIQDPEFADRLREALTRILLGSGDDHEGE